MRWLYEFKLVGSLAELKAMEMCLNHGIMVFTPFADGCVVDLVLIVNGKCLKAQVKSTETGSNGVLSFKMKSEKSKRGKDTVHHYTEEEIDIFLLYSYFYDEVYVVPFKEAPRSCLTLRHDKPKRILKTMKFANDYLFEEKIYMVV
jgi:hypothetical protein